MLIGHLRRISGSLILRSDRLASSIRIVPALAGQRNAFTFWLRLYSAYCPRDAGTAAGTAALARPVACSTRRKAFGHVAPSPDLSARVRAHPGFHLARLEPVARRITARHRACLRRRDLQPCRPCRGFPARPFSGRGLEMASCFCRYRAPDWRVFGLTGVGLLPVGTVASRATLLAMLVLAESALPRGSAAASGRRKPRRSKAPRPTLVSMPFPP